MYKILFDQLASSRHAFLITIIIGIALVLPSLAAGLFADDFLHAVLIGETGLVKQPDNLSLFHLFSFIDTDTERRMQLFGFSITPWWISPDFSLLFFRPLSEITHYIDYTLFREHVPLMHLHSIIWYAAVLALVAYIYHLFCPSRKLALLSLLLFIADSTHGFTVSWLANRNVLIAATFSLLALACHYHFREKASYWYLFFSLLCIICSFLAAESGIVVGTLLFAYAIFYDKAGYLRGLLYLLPAFVIFIIWISLYKHYGYGAIGNYAYYIDPIESSGLFLQNLPDRFLRTLAIQFNALPVHLVKPYQAFMLAAGSFFFALLLLALAKSQSSSYRFFLCFLFLAIIPITSGELQDRNMLFVGIAACPILAQAILYLHHLHAQYIRRPLLTIIIGFHLGISALLMLPISYAPKILASSSISTAESLPADITGQYIISVGIPVFDASYIAAIRRIHHLPLPKQLWNVTTRTQGLRITRQDSHTMVIDNPEGLLGDIDFMLRSMRFDPISIGETINMNGLLLTIDKINLAGTPVTATLEVNPSIQADDIVFYHWSSMQLVPFSLGIGEHRTF